MTAIFCMFRAVDSNGTPWADIDCPRDGATTADMLKNVQLVDDADVLVILAGTNDSAQGVPFESTARNMQKIAVKVGPHG